MHGGMQGFLSLFLQQRGVDMRIDLASFLEDVADALVGGSQCSTFRQGGKGAHGLKTLDHIRQPLRLQGEHSIHLVGRIAAVDCLSRIDVGLAFHGRGENHQILVQVPAQTVVEKFSQRLRGMANLVSKGWRRNG